jgi:hypothetical protein
LEQQCSVGRDPPFRQDVGAEAEESPLLEAVSKKRLITLRTLVCVCVTVICKVWEISYGAIIKCNYEL